MNHLRANGPLDRHPESYYAAITPRAAERPRAQGDMEVDLCVIGGGFTGLAAAHHAAEAGLTVCVLEAARLGWGASGRNGGQISGGFNWSLRKLTKTLGEETAWALWQEAEEARDWLISLAKNSPRTELTHGILSATLKEAEHKAQMDAANWLAKTYGISTPCLTPKETAAKLGTDIYTGGTYDPKAAFCNPLALCHALAATTEAAGACLFEQSEVTQLKKTGRRWHVTTPAAQITARYVLQATNGLGTGLTKQAARHILPLNNYIAVTAPLETPPMPEPVAVADSRAVVNYYWQTPDGRLLFGGGESYGARFPSDIARKVGANLSRVYPQLKDVEITHAWGGTLAVTPTRLPYLATPAPGLYIAGGYSGHGLALAPHYGRAIAEAITGDTSRLTLLSHLPAPALPGGKYIGGPLTNLAMALSAMRDRLTYAT